MAAHVLTAARVEIGGTNISQWVRQCELSIERDAPEQTTMGDSTKRVIAGLMSWSVSLTLAQDFAASAVDQTIYNAFSAGTPVTVKIRPTNAAISATNPEYSGSGIITSYNPISGSVGDFHETSVEIQSAGDLTRATS